MNRDDVFMGSFLFGSVAVPTLLIVVVIWSGNRLQAYNSYVNASAEIEQLRHDVRRVDAASNEDVIGQVTQWNQTIASNKAQRKAWGWWSFIRPEWDSIEPITLSKEEPRHE